MLLPLCWAEMPESSGLRNGEGEHLGLMPGDPRGLSQPWWLQAKSSEATGVTNARPRADGRMQSSVPERWVRNLILGKRLRWEQQWGSLGKGSVLRSSQCLQVFTAEKHCLPSAARIRSQPHSLKNFAFKSKKAQRNGKLSKAQMNVYFTEQTSSKWGFGRDFCWVVFFVWSSGEELSLAQMWKGTTNCRAAGLHSRHTWE